MGDGLSENLLQDGAGWGALKYLETNTLKKLFELTSKVYHDVLNGINKILYYLNAF